MSEINDIPVFPQETKIGIFPGLSKREWYATFAPTPSPEEIERNRRRDTNKNPHNEPHKPKLRSTAEIIADLKFQYADAMITASRKGSDRG